MVNTPLARSLIFLTAALGLGFAAFFTLATAAMAQPAINDQMEPLCRLGVNHAGAGELTAFDLSPLRTGFFIDYRADTAARPAGMKQMRMVRLNQPDKNSTNYTANPNGATITSLAQTNPGEIWLIGNEPDRTIYQDDLTPQAYSRAYHELRQMIKAADPTATVVAGNIVQASPLRLRYLDLVLTSHRNTYGENMEVDAWGIHTFILNEQVGNWGAEIPRGVTSTTQYRFGVNQDLIGELDAQQISTTLREQFAQNGINLLPQARVEVMQVGNQWKIVDGDDTDEYLLIRQGGVINVYSTQDWVLTTAQNADFSFFQRQIRSFRTWMSENGYRNVPLYITEHGVLMPDGYGYGPFSPAEVSEYMRRTFDYMLNSVDSALGYPSDDNRLVQNFAWYSVNDKIKLVEGRFEGFNGYLFDPDLGNQRSPMGDAYVAFAAQLPSQTDLLVSDLWTDPAIPLVSNGPVTITIQAKVGNAGNTSSEKDFDLRLYNGDPGAGGQLLSGAEFAGMAPGCGSSRIYTYIWPNVQPGEYDIFAVVSPGAGVIDVKPANNRLQRKLIFATDLVYLPSVQRR